MEINYENRKLLAKLIKNYAMECKIIFISKKTFVKINILFPKHRHGVLETNEIRQQCFLFLFIFILATVNLSIFKF